MKGCLRALRKPDNEFYIMFLRSFALVKFGYIFVKIFFTVIMMKT